MRNLFTGTQLVNCLTPASWSATSQSTLLDRANYQASGFVISLGANSGTAFDASNKITFKVQESDTTAAADFTDVAATDLLQDGAVMSANAIVVDSDAKASRLYGIEYRGSKRYIRLVATETGTIVIPLAIAGLLARPTYAPVGSPIQGTSAT